jgi:hypothetical protein
MQAMLIVLIMLIVVAVVLQVVDRSLVIVAAQLLLENPMESQGRNQGVQRAKKKVMRTNVGGQHYFGGLSK